MVEDRERNPRKAPVEIPKDSRERIRWSLLGNDPDVIQAAIETETRKLLDRGVKLTDEGLKAAGISGISGFVAGIYRLYPGDLRGLREKLGVSEDLGNSEIDSIGLPRDKKGRVRWSLVKDKPGFTEIMESYGSDLIARGVHLTRDTLREKQRGGFLEACRRYYPGGYKALQVRLNQATLHKWVVPQTKEGGESLQLGIQNIQIMFLRTFPEFNELFPRGDNGQVDPSKQKEAADFIKGHTGASHTQFKEVFGGACLVRTAVPYFKGSYLIALKRAFAPWGIEFIVHGEPDMNGDTWIPKHTIYRKYGISVELFEKLAENIPTRSGWDKKGRTITLLREADVARVAKTHTSSPKVDQETGVYRDRKGTWASIPQLAKKLGIHVHTVKHFLGGVRQITGRTGYGQGELYNLADVKRNAAEFLALPQVDRQTRIWTDSQGQEWAPRNYLIHHLGIFYTGLNECLNEVIAKSGRDVKGRTVLLYRIGEVRKVLEARGYKPKERKQKDSSITISPEQANEQLRKLLEGGIMTTERVEAKPQPAFEIPRRGTMIKWRLPGNTPEQDEQLGIRIIQALFLEKFPKFDDQFPRGEDERIAEGKRKEARDFILEKLGTKEKFSASLGSTAVFKKSVPYFEGSYVAVITRSFMPWGLDFGWDKATGSSLARYDNGNIAWNRLSSLSEEETKSLIEQEARRLLSEGIELNTVRLTATGHLNFMAGVYRHYPGRLAALKDNLNVRHTKRPSGYWIPETIKDEARKLMAKIGSTTLPPIYSFRELGRQDLASAISKYPGGVIGLRLALDQSLIQRPDGYWTPERIIEEAKAFYQTDGGLTQELLAQKRKTYLIRAISHYYPGGMYQLKLDLGISANKRPDGYWTPERIRREAEEFYQQEGELSPTKLDQLGKSTLARAIYVYYPGGSSQLRTDLSIESSSKPPGYWTHEKIEEEAREFYKEYGLLTQKMLRESGRGDLQVAINARYPGRLTQLKINLGIELSGSSPTARPISPEQANEQLRRLLEGSL